MLRTHTNDAHVTARYVQKISGQLQRTQKQQPQHTNTQAGNQRQHSTAHHNTTQPTDHDKTRARKLNTTQPNRTQPNTTTRKLSPPYILRGGDASGLGRCVVTLWEGKEGFRERRSTDNTASNSLKSITTLYFAGW